MKEVPYIIFLFLFIGFTSGQIVIPCQFENNAFRGYECRLPDVDLSMFPNFTIGGDQHLPGFNDLSVVSFFSIHNNFVTFPTQQLTRFPSLIQIKISESLITELPAQSVANRPALTHLTLSSNLISSIHINAFQNSGFITSLNLQFNELRNIDNNVFATLPLLQDLDLSFNLIERIPPQTFSNTRNLASLNLNNNRGIFINQTFFTNLPQLRVFFFQNNLCYSGSFFQLEVPGNLANMFQRLQPCFLEGPAQFNCIFGFEHEGMVFEDYTCLLRGIEAYDQAREINLGGFHLLGKTNVDVGMVWVFLADTRFILSEVFREFVNLRGLQIELSQLEMLQPNAFQNANNLQFLHIQNNNVRRLEANSFVGATRLETIRIVSSQLEIVHENAFQTLINLRELSLFEGRIRTFGPNTFAPLPQLRFLEASRNDLEIVDSRWFTNNLFIQQLSMNDNRINAVNPGIVDIPTLTVLQLLRNVCVNNLFMISPVNREQVRAQLNTCILNYPRRLRIFRMEVEGGMSLFFANGTLVGQFN